MGTYMSVCVTNFSHHFNYNQTLPNTIPIHAKIYMRVSNKPNLSHIDT